MKFLFMLLFTFWLFANDAEYITSANGLTPINSKDIELKKEVLNITRLKDGYFRVDIEYLLFNKAASKDTVIGFEAPRPIGEDNEYNDFFYKNYNISKKHKAELEAIAKNKKPSLKPDIEDFKVSLNGKKLKYEIVDVSKLKGSGGSTDYVGYLYYFNANLKQGENRIKQSYKCITSASVISRYEFEYILATAKEWSGGKIGDIEINFNMGAFESFQMQPTFFDSLDNWIAKNGLIKYEKGTFSEEKVAKFYLKDGKVTFKKKNFTPKDGIKLMAFHYYRLPDADKKLVFNYKTVKLPFVIYYDKNIEKNCQDYNCFTFFAKDYKSLKILKNLPFARRGYIFKTDFIANYYKKMPWYKKDANYKATLSTLTEKEREWLNSIEKIKFKILRNLPFAKRGYVFKDNRLNLFFLQFNWYKANENYIPDIKDLNKKELSLIKKIKSKKSIKDNEFFDILNRF